MIGVKVCALNADGTVKVAYGHAQTADLIVHCAPTIVALLVQSECGDILAAAALPPPDPADRNIRHTLRLEYPQ